VDHKAPKLLNQLLAKGLRKNYQNHLQRQSIWIWQFICSNSKSETLLEINNYLNVISEYSFDMQ
jgi:hypothetical protein